MQPIIDLLSSQLGQAFQSLGLSFELGKVFPSSRPDLADFQCNGSLEGAKQLQIPPLELAKKVVDLIQANNLIQESIQSCTVAEPGFINLLLKPECILEYLTSLTSSQNLGINLVSEPKHLLVDYGGANVAKPMHVGHLRSLVIGDAIAKTMKLLGHTVTTDIHLGDWGTQMGMLISELKITHPELPYFDLNFSGPYPDESPVRIEDLEIIYPQVSAKCKEDPERLKLALEATRELQAGRPGYYALWKHFQDVSIKCLKSDIQTLGINFDLWNGESNVNDLIPSLLDQARESGVLQSSDGAEVIYFPEESKLPPFLVVKSDGAYLYSTTDLATIVDRVKNQQIEAIIYTADSRQALHFKQLFEAAKTLHLVPDHFWLAYAPFGTMNGPDGKPFKTRSGGAFKLIDLIEMVRGKAKERMLEAGIGASLSIEEQERITNQVSIAAIKFGDLINNRNSDYIFDLDRFTAFEGKTGPSVVYTAVRINSIFARGNFNLQDAYPLTILNQSERYLALLLTQFPQVLAKTGAELLPSLLAEYLFQIAQEYNRFYQTNHILNEKDLEQKNSWLGLSKLTYQILNLGLNTLGIEIPAKM